MFITFNQVVAHLVGDYLIQTEWMVARKTKNLYVAILHALSYSLPFLFFTHSWLAMFVIIWTHSVIDRLSLARYICAWKNGRRVPTTRSGLTEPTHEAITTDSVKQLAINAWIFILIDNMMHITINGLAIKYL